MKIVPQTHVVGRLRSLSKLAAELADQVVRGKRSFTEGAGIDEIIDDHFDFIEEDFKFIAQLVDDVGMGRVVVDSGEDS